jgi:pseudaminic acid synthase
MTETLFNRIKNHSKPPVVIAELSANHNQSIDNAKKIIAAAAKSGADGVKLQTYTADTLTIDCDQADFVISDPNSLWHGRKLHALYQEAYTPWEWHAELFEYAKNLGLEIFSTPFDETAVDFLEQLNVSCYKVASFEVTHIPLLAKVAKTKKPVIMSSGMCSYQDLELAIDTLRTNGAKDILILRCCSAYPAPHNEINLNSMAEIAKRFKVEVGLSDHTLNHVVAITSVALGARLIEKHFTISRADGGPDSAFSIEPKELEELVLYCKHAWESLGQTELETGKTEKASLAFRQSIYAVKDIKQGEAFSTDNIRIIRPGYGLAPKEFSLVLNKKASTNIARGTALKLNHLV